MQLHRLSEKERIKAFETADQAMNDAAIRIVQLSEARKIAAIFDPILTQSLEAEIEVMRMRIEMLIKAKKGS
jgi:hypothetical protein